jgi:hypothetical protein
MHWTKFDFSLDTNRTVFLYGLTLSVGGAAEGYITAAIHDDIRVFAGPLIGDQFTEYPDRDSVRMFTFPAHARIDFPEPFFISSLTLWHQSADGQRYTIKDIRPHHAPADYHDLLRLPRPKSSHRYWPSRLAHTTPRS